MCIFLSLELYYFNIQNSYYTFIGCLKKALDEFAWDVFLNIVTQQEHTKKSICTIQGKVSLHFQKQWFLGKIG